MGKVQDTTLRLASLFWFQDEIQAERVLLWLRIDLRDQGAVPWGRHSEMQVYRASRITSGDISLITVAPIGGRTLGGTVGIIVLTLWIGRPPFQPCPT